MVDLTETVKEIIAAIGQKIRIKTPEEYSLRFEKSSKINPKYLL